MKLTEVEIEMVECLRGLSEHRAVRLTASFENGMWECESILTPHPAYFSCHPECSPDAVFVWRGVGTSFVEAFANLAGNNDEPLEDAA
jgi:hypothetical protein